MPPALDGILTAVSLVGALYLSSQHETGGFGAASTSHTGTLVGGVTLAVLFGVSALYGVSGVSNCRVARGLAPGGGPAPGEVNANRRAEEAAEEAAVRARVSAKSAADAKATPDGASLDAGAAPDPAP